MSLKRTPPPGVTVQTKNTGVQIVNSMISMPTTISQLARSYDTVLTKMPTIPTTGLISSALTSSDINSQNTASAKKPGRDLPIIIYNKEATFNIRFKSRNQIANNQYELKILRVHKIKIQPKTIEMYEIITKALEDKNTDFHTFRSNQDKTFNVVLKCTHSSTLIDELKGKLKKWVMKSPIFHT